jgi:WD40 repeat protein
MKQAPPVRRASFTLGELLVAIAIVAIVAGIVITLRQEIKNAGRTIDSMVFSMDGARLVAAFSDGSVEAWSLKNGKRVGHLLPLKDFVGAVIAADGNTVARIQSDFSAPSGVIQISDLASKNEDVLLTFDDANHAIQLSSNGKLLAIADQAGNRLIVVDINDLDKQESILTPLQLNNPNLSLAYWPEELRFSRDGQTVYYIRSGHDFVKWNLKTEQAVRYNFPNSKGPPAVWQPPLAISPDGNSIAVVGSESTLGNPLRYFVGRLSASDLSFINRGEAGEDYIFGIEFSASGKTLAVLRSDLTILDAETLAITKQIQLESRAVILAASSAAELFAASDGNSIYLYDGSQLRKFVEFSSDSGGLIWLLTAFCVAIALFGIMRQKRKMSTCIQCSKKWLPDKTNNSRCPDCRVMHLTTSAVAEQSKWRWPRMILPLLLYVIVTMIVGSWVMPYKEVEGNGWKIAIWFAMAPVVVTLILFGLFVGAVLALILIRRRQLRRYKDFEYTLTKAREVAGCEGHLEQLGPITLWTDAKAPLNVTAESIAAEMNDCRRQFEEFTGDTCGPVRPISIFLFESSETAHRYKPPGSTGDAAEEAVYLGVINHAYLSIETMHRHLTTVRLAIRSVLVGHTMPSRRGVANRWLALGVGTYIAWSGEFEERKTWRRAIAVWFQEKSLISLRELLQQRGLIFAASAKTMLLPEKRERLLKIIHQLVSLADYFVGVDAPADRRQQFQQIWQELQRQRSFDRACNSVLGCDLATFENHWKAWVATVEFGPPVSPPPEIVVAAETLVIPLLNNNEAPVQERIKATRSIGGSAWSIGIKPLEELLTDPQPDIQREAKRALQYLYGRLEL